PLAADAAAPTWQIQIEQLRGWSHRGDPGAKRLQPILPAPGCRLGPPPPEGVLGGAAAGPIGRGGKRGWRPGASWLPPRCGRTCQREAKQEEPEEAEARAGGGGGGSRRPPAGLTAARPLAGEAPGRRRAWARLGAWRLERSTTPAGLPGIPTRGGAAAGPGSAEHRGPLSGGRLHLARDRGRHGSRAAPGSRCVPLAVEILRVERSRRTWNGQAGWT
ncbi:hypothetical protein HispidOSU_013128, partial [Sigmodon hispidus]